MIKRLLKGRQIPRVLYHWSPLNRIPSIIKRGLKINQPSLDGKWKPDHICFSDTPVRALLLCSHVPNGTTMVLWEVYPMRTYAVRRTIVPRNSGLIPEWRIYNDVPKGRMFMVGAKKMSGRGRRIPKR